MISDEATGAAPAPPSERARGALLGLAVGDALGAPTEGMTPAAIRREYGRVTGFLSADAAGTDDTEYAVLCAQGLLRHGSDLTPDDVAAVWQEALRAQVGAFHKAGFSEMTAIANLAAGLRPPVSGTDSYESWSDGAAMRAAPIGVFCAGDPAEAARLAAVDACVSHTRDGIYGAQAIAAAVATAMTAADHGAVTASALAALPEDSWSRRLARQAVDIALAAADPTAAEADLYREIPLFHYPWADAAPEAVALALGLFTAHRGALNAGVLSGVNIGRDSDTIAAMVGAMAGALNGSDAIDPAWRHQVRMVAGRCITATSGTDLRELADALYTAGRRVEEGAHL
ncbi:ADP-ribosylglycohydrolase [Murinocardiopsis flavida]|uniref:ADP-ribosylglycohydrolase n=1 Tax=Murinocardiopsis flavida TaxID=645275 RepID=A0A2P8D571_9ACTN|nr:ADP-ribosylglycohydrolase family protein [Murinocardiopsis flavida]PSK92364.1 ADP-ribosylglycohydrolase [Murinocardiopsis flavida]